MNENRANNVTAWRAEAQRRREHGPSITPGRRPVSPKFAKADALANDPYGAPKHSEGGSPEKIQVNPTESK
jgi:hypothetical protein